MAITHLNRFHLRAVRKGTKVSELSLDNMFSKLILILWTSLAELEFNILVTSNEHLADQFSKMYDLSNKSIIEKWCALIDYLFKERFLKSQRKKISILNLGDTNYHRYKALSNVVIDDLGLFVELRNRVAHGQWAIAFNSLGLNKNDALTKHIWILSKKEMMLLKAFVTNLPILLKLLINSENSFEVEYDKYMNKIIRAKIDADLKFEWLRKNLLRGKGDRFI